METSNTRDGFATQGCIARMAETCLRGTAAALGLLIVAPYACLAAEHPPWRIERAEVRIVVPLKPGGAFEAKTVSVTGALTAGTSRPVSLTGEISVDLATIDTGIGLRNQHLREKYLEVSKGSGFDRAVLSEIRVNDAESDEFQGQSGFAATLLLHGTKEAVAGTAQIRRSGSEVRVTATFPLTLTDFGIVPPEYLGVGVADRVLVKVSLTTIKGENAPD
jgi:polyisoprenoid-binding protein YceI